MHQLLNWNFYNASGFGIKVFQLTDFQKNYVRKITFRLLSLRENHIFCILSMLFERHHFELKTLQRFGLRTKSFHLVKVFALLKNSYKNCSHCVPHINTWTVLIHFSSIESVENLSPIVEKCLIMCREEFILIKETKVWTKCPELRRGGSRGTSIERV